MNAAISYLQHLFIPSYLTILYAFLSGAAYGVTGHKYGFIKVTITCLLCSVVYVAYALGAFK
jgi:lipoprotein signal peptidase